MRYSIPYCIFLDLEKADQVDMEKVWEIIDSMPSPTPEIFHLFYDLEGNPLEITANEVRKKFDLSYGRLNTVDAKVFRTLRYPYYRNKYMKKETKDSIELKNFTSEQLLEELARRLKNVR